MSKPTFIAVAGEDRFKHQFGGAGWKLVVPGSSTPEPAVILTLDASDERLGIDWPGDRLPLASRLDVKTPVRQSYVIEDETRTLVFEGQDWLATGDEISVLPNPLPERRLRLRAPEGNEDLAKAPSKYETHDTFIGGSAFMRIGGQPLWLLDPENVECPCGRVMPFLACVGYENYDRPSGLIPGVPFFLGELALFFFACPTCSSVVALTQST